MVDEIRCEVLRIVYPDWSIVTTGRKDALWEIINNNLIVGDTPERKAFVGVVKNEDIIAGFYAHEGERQGIQYDAKLNREINKSEEFEHLFFALFLEQGQLALQRKNIDKDFVTINLGVLRKSCIELLGLAFFQAGFSSQKILTEEFTIRRTRDEMQKLFMANPVSYVRIQNLLGKEVPPGYQLFNPDLDKDEIYKQVFRDDAQELDYLEGRTIDPNGDLRNTIIMKAAIQAGDPSVVKAIVDEEERTFRSEQTEKFGVGFSTDPGDKIKTDDIVRITKKVTTEYFIPKSIIDSDHDYGPIFGDGTESEINDDEK